MKSKNDLLERIKELENLVQILREQINILQNQIQQKKDFQIEPWPWKDNDKTPLSPYYPYLPTDDVCIDGGQHKYPTVWHGIIPPSCEKCGKQSSRMMEITCESNSNSISPKFNYSFY